MPQRARMVNGDLPRREEIVIMYEEDGIAFDVAPRGPTWRPYQGVLPPRLKMRLGRRIAQARETLDPERFDDGRELAALESLAAGRERFWTGKDSPLDRPLSACSSFDDDKAVGPI